MCLSLSPIVLLSDIACSPAIRITMTLTAPGCPVAKTIPGTVERAMREVTGVDDVQVTLTFDPPWMRERMSEAAQLQLGMF